MTSLLQFHSTRYIVHEPVGQSVPFGGLKLMVIFEKVYTPIVGKCMIAFCKW